MIAVIAGSRSARWSVLAVLLLFSATAAVGAVRNADESFFDTTFGDFSEELANAREQGKKGILIMFEMDECPFCHRMKTTVLNQSEIQDYFKEHFLIFPVDIEGDVEVTDFQGQHAGAEGLRSQTVPGAGDAGVRILRFGRQSGCPLHGRDAGLARVSVAWRVRGGAASMARRALPATSWSARRRRISLGIFFKSPAIFSQSSNCDEGR